jgi:CheY-like chemotaxis protein
MADDKEEALQAGFNDYISKPIMEEELLDVINKHTKQ